jgi:DHA1 family bicyclomycin/chloramphenicol resistance-like MFS transporter
VSTPSGIRPVLLLVLGLLSALTPFAIDMYLPSIPAIARDLGADVELVQLSITVYLAVFAAAQLVLGPLSDVHGRRRIIGLGLLVFMLANIGCALAPSMEVMLLARAVQAVGGAAVAVTVPALVRDLFDRDDYARIMGMVMLVMGLAPLVAPSVGGVIILYASWRWVFGALLIIALGAALLFFRLVPETLHSQQRHVLNVRGIIANYGVLLRHRAALGYLLTGAASFGGMMIFIVASPYVYIELHHVPAARFGPLFGINILAAMLFAFLNSRLVPRLGAERLLRGGLAVQGLAALLLLAVALLPQPALWVIALAAVSYISMAGIVMGNSMAGFMAFFPTMAGTASAFTGAVRFGFGALAGSAVSLLHDGSALPLLLGMGVCGLLAVTLYRLLCCFGAPRGAAAMTEERRAAADASVP